MKNKVAILMDSGCDLPDALIEKYGIFVLRLKLSYGTRLYEDGVDIQAEEIYRRFPREIPKTSMPNEFDVMDLVQKIRRDGYQKIIAICISSALSGTFSVVKRTLDTLKDIESYVLDTRNISIGSGMFALWTARMLEQGHSFEEITKRLPEKLSDSRVYFYMDTLKYLQAGGRIGKVTATLGSLLNLKPIISCNENGVYHTVALIRGKRAGVRRLLEATRVRGKENAFWLGLMNGGAAKEAEELKPFLLDTFRNSELVVEKQIIATLAVHTGPGLLGVGVFDPAF